MSFILAASAGARRRSVRLVRDASRKEFNVQKSRRATCLAKSHAAKTARMDAPSLSPTVRVQLHQEQILLANASESRLWVREMTAPIPFSLWKLCASCAGCACAPLVRVRSARSSRKRAGTGGTHKNTAEMPSSRCEKLLPQCLHCWQMKRTVMPTPRDSPSDFSRRPIRS